MNSTTKILLVFGGIVVLLLLAALVAVIVYYAFFRKTPSSFPLPAVQGVPTEFATSNGMLPNGSNSLDMRSTTNAGLGCTSALNQNSMGYQIINNSGITQFCYLNNIYYNSNTCGSGVTLLLLSTVNPNITLNWYDISSGKDNTGALVYPTFYLNSVITFTNSSNNTSISFYPGGSGDINISKQYYQITFNNDGTYSGKPVNA